MPPDAPDMRALVRDALARRGWHSDDDTIATLAAVASGWLAGEEQSIIGLPVPGGMIDDYAETIVNYFGRGGAMPPATRAEFKSIARAAARSTLAQLPPGQALGSVVACLGQLALGAWNPSDGQAFLQNFAHEFARCWLLGR